jgi:hypothetical protein
MSTNYSAEIFEALGNYGAAANLRHYDTPESRYAGELERLRADADELMAERDHAIADAEHLRASMCDTCKAKASAA